MLLLLLLSEAKIFQRTNKLRSHSFNLQFLAKISSSYLVNSCHFCVIFTRVEISGLVRRTNELIRF